MKFGNRVVIAALAVVVLALAVGLIALPAAAGNSRSASSTQAGPNAEKAFEELLIRMHNGDALSDADKVRYDELHEIYGGAFDSDRANRDGLDNTGGPDSYGYAYVDNQTGDTATYGWIELRGQEGVTWINSWVSYDDGCSNAMHPIGFSFPLYGTNYTDFYVTSNGGVMFGSCNAGSYYSCLPNASVGPAIFPFLYDLHLQRGGDATGNNVVGYKNFGTYTVIEFDSIGFFSSTYTGSSLKFQVILYNSGRVKIQYNNMVYVGSPEMGTVGMQNNAGAINLQYRCYTDGNGIKPLNNNLAIWYFLPSGIPSPVTNFSGSAAGQTVTLTWTDPTLDINGDPITVDSVKIMEGATRVGGVGPGVQTLVINSVAEGNHSYTAIAYNSGFASTGVSTSVVVGNATYAQDFEANDGLWISDNENGWQWGTPSGQGPGGANSGVNCWGTVLNGLYPNSSCFAMDLTLGLEVNDPTARIEFFVWYETEGDFSPWDGFNLQVSIDGGSTWTIVTPEVGYSDESSNNTCIGQNPNVNGTDGMFWHNIVFPIGDFEGEVPIFKILFGSDASVQYSGVYIDDMTIWGLAQPQQANVSGTVTLNGGTGTVTNVLVRSNGLGNPQAHPNAQGAYSLNNVQVGNRVITAELAGYVTYSAVLAVPEGGVTNYNITLNRVPPPAPTNLTATVNSGTGEVTLNWDNSTDTEVDRWYLYRKLRDDHDWVYQTSFSASDGTHQLATPGIWQFAVTAVDSIGPVNPVESSRSNVAEVIYGEIPPTHLSANGNFDDRIRLRWLAPGVNQPPLELFYDDGTSEQWFRVQTPNGQSDYFAVVFTPPDADTTSYPLPVQTCNIYMERSDPLPNVWIAPDAGGVPDLENPYMNWTEIGADGDPGWIIANTDGQVMLEDDSDFWVIWQFPPGITGPGTGSDQNAPDMRSYWTLDAGATWNLWTAHDWMARVWVGAPQDRLTVLSSGNPSGYSAAAVPSVSIVDPNLMAKARNSGQPFQVRDLVSTSDWSSVVTRAIEAPFSVAPILQPVSRDRSALDEVLYFIVYRDNVDIAHPTEAPYDNMVSEGIDYSYRVTAWYDNNVESGPTSTITTRAAMPPAAPGNVTGASLSSTMIRISWTDPTTNADDTPCIDLANLRVYRDGVLIATVAPGVGLYDDTPPQPNRTYQWDVRGIDEVPNEGPSGSFVGSVVLPWNEASYDWVDISAIGTSTGMTGDDQNSGPYDLGFDFIYFGNTYNSIRVCSNGWASFTSTSTTYWNLPIPDINEPNNGLYVFWDDMYLPMGGDVMYYQDTANQRFIISWLDVPHIMNTEALYTYQIIITQAGEVKFQYHTIPEEDPSNTDCTVGVENAAGTAAFQLYHLGAGDFAPISSSAVSFYGPPPVYANISGTVTLDGQSNSVTNAVVRALNGANRPQANPAADGTYTLVDVQVGNSRNLEVSLTGYHTVNRTVNLPEGGLNNENFTLRRLNPVAPTGLVVVSVSPTGLISLNWDDSPDLYVDQYKVWRKMRADPTWPATPLQTIAGRTNSQTTDQVTTGGIYQYRITAVDVDVIAPPVESDPSAYVEAPYGALPPQMLTANGRFDNKIRLAWMDPVSPPEVEVSYDDGENDVDGIGWWGGNPSFGWLVAHYQGTGTVVVTRLKIFFTDFATVGDPISVGLFADDGTGIPTFEPLGVVETTHEDPINEWREIDIDPPVVFNDGSFFVGCRQMTTNSIAVGGDDDNEFPANQFFYSFDATAWTSYDQSGLFSIPMQRAWVIGDMGPGLIEMAPSAVPTSKWDAALAHKTITKTSASKNVAAKTAVGPVRNNPSLDSGTEKPSHESLMAEAASKLNNSRYGSPADPNRIIVTDAHADVVPASMNSDGRNGHGSLDEVINYRVYEGATQLAELPPTQFNYDHTPLVENVPHTYHVTAIWTGFGESISSNVVTASCNMPPAAPSQLSGNPVGTTQMRLQWVDPTTNDDATPCVDLASVRIYRDGQLIGTVAAGTQLYMDTPPVPDQFYTWTVKAIDEVPNESVASTSFIGAVQSPWLQIEMEWVDISGVGQNTGMGNDDQNSGPFQLGFNFTYYGQTYNSIYVCSNGWASFTSTSTAYWNGTIPDAQEPHTVMYPFWDDMYLPQGGSVLYYADAANDRFIISWIDVPHISWGGAYSFQIILEPDQTITYNYLAIENNTDCTVGIEDQTSSNAIELCSLGSGPFLPTSGTAVQFYGGPSGDLTGVVRAFGTNLPIQDAHIWAVGWPDTAITDATGTYGMGMEPGNYVLHVDHANYCSETYDIVIEDGSTTTRNSVLRQPQAQFSVTSLNIECRQNLTAQTSFTISNNGGQCALSFSIADTSAWLSTNPTSGTIEPNQMAEITVTVAAGARPVGSEWQSPLVVTYNGLGTPVSIPIFMNVTAVNIVGSEVPTEFAFNGNYPNPFNPVTELRFDVAQQSHVQLTVFNVMGQEVGRPVNEVLAAGRYQVAWDAANLPSGLYVVRMTAGSYTATGKMMLLK